MNFFRQGRFLRIIRLLMIAVMLGVSNVVYEECKMVNNMPTEVQADEEDEVKD